MKISRRKIRVIFDRNIPEDFISRIMATRWLMNSFKILGIAIDRLPDRDLMNYVVQEDAILITGDQDFWNDSNFKLQESPGIVVFTTDQADQMVNQLTSLLSNFNFVVENRRIKNYMRQVKVKVSDTKICIKYLSIEGRQKQEDVFIKHFY